MYPSSYKKPSYNPKPNNNSYTKYNAETSNNSSFENYNNYSGKGFEPPVPYLAQKQSNRDKEREIGMNPYEIKQASSQLKSKSEMEVSKKEDDGREKRFTADQMDNFLAD